MTAATSAADPTSTGTNSTGTTLTGGAVRGVEAAAARLITASRDRTPCAPVRDLLEYGDLATGYVVQRLVGRSRLAQGRRPVGRKVGLTSAAVQRQLGVGQPDFGVLWDDMACEPGRTVPLDRLLQPRVEAEIAFVLDRDLNSDLDGDLDGDLDDVRARAVVEAAIDHAVAALEICDSRIAGWDITLVDTVADNASSGLYVLGADPVAWTVGHDLRGVRMELTNESGQVVSSGTGADCLGDPVAALVWLARIAQELGDPLRAGDVVLSGALGPMVPVGPGSVVTAVLHGLGDVAARFELGAP